MAKFKLQLITLNYRETILWTDLSNKQMMYLSNSISQSSNTQTINDFLPNWSYTKIQREKIDWDWYWNVKNTPYKKTSIQILKYTTVLSLEFCYLWPRDPRPWSFWATAVLDNTRPALSKMFQDFGFFCDVKQTVTVASTVFVK